MSSVLPFSVFAHRKIMALLWNFACMLLAYSIILCIPSYKFKVLKVTGIYLKKKQFRGKYRIFQQSLSHILVRLTLHLLTFFFCVLLLKLSVLMPFEYLIGFQPKMSKIAALKRNFMNGIFWNFGGKRQIYTRWGKAPRRYLPSFSWTIEKIQEGGGGRIYPPQRSAC